MKQIIQRNSNGKIGVKYYENNRKLADGLWLGYWENDGLSFKGNFLDGWRYGICTKFCENGKIQKQSYYL